MAFRPVLFGCPAFADVVVVSRSANDKVIVLFILCYFVFKINSSA